MALVMECMNVELIEKESCAEITEMLQARGWGNDVSK